MISQPPSDYENRDVNYTSIHGETKEVFSKFVSALDLKPHQKLLDIGGGYGAVLTHILEDLPGFEFQYDLLDNSVRQLEKAKKNMDGFLSTHPAPVTINYICQNAVEMDLPASTYDIIVCKMFIHEIPANNKQALFAKIFASLKPGGSLVVWNPHLEEDDHSFYVNTIRRKDELAQFNSLVQNRHFLLNNELIFSLANAGFSSTEKLFDFNYDLHTSLRLKAEFGNDMAVLRQWHEYILELSAKLSPELRKNLLVDVTDNNIHIRFKRAVFKAVKA